MWSVKGGMCGVYSVEWRVWSVDCKVLNVECGVQSVEVKCGV